MERNLLDLGEKIHVYNRDSLLFLQKFELHPMLYDVDWIRMEGINPGTQTAKRVRRWPGYLYAFHD